VLDRCGAGAARRLGRRPSPEPDVDLGGIKREAGRLRAPRNLAALLAADFRMPDVTVALLEAAAELPRHHADPFDRV
jgi:hypothetical protein